MNIQELQRIVIAISNKYYVRWFAWYNYPYKPQLMAIKIIDHDNSCIELPELVLMHGFKQGDEFIYTIEKSFIKG